jgi:hypothetical protein
LLSWDATFSERSMSGKINAMNRLLYNSLLIQILLAGTATCLSISCKKNNSADLLLLQHKWQIVSLNGEALRYVGQPGDYFDFGTDKQLVRFLNNHYDTLNYQVIDGGSALQLFPVLNSVQTGGKLTLSIKTLTSGQLILSNSGPTSPPIYLLDSLSR